MIRKRVNMGRTQTDAIAIVLERRQVQKVSHWLQESVEKGRRNEKVFTHGAWEHMIMNVWRK